MFKRERRDVELEKLNLVPIMDAVFIFIFFLLFSAQFIKLFEIETEAPIVNEVPSTKTLEKEPLNLKIKIHERKIELTKGLDDTVVETFFKRESEYLRSLKINLIKYRIKFPEDNQIIISPIPIINYEEIVKVIDIAQTVEDEIAIDTKKGKKVLKKIFSQVVLEPLEDV